MSFTCNIKMGRVWKELWEGVIAVFCVVCAVVCVVWLSGCASFNVEFAGALSYGDNQRISRKTENNVVFRDEKASVVAEEKSNDAKNIEADDGEVVVDDSAGGDGNLIHEEDLYSYRGGASGPSGTKKAKPFNPARH